MRTIQSLSAFNFQPNIGKMQTKKNTKFRMLPETTIFNFMTLHTPVLVNFENKIFPGWACQILGKDKWKNRAETGKMLKFLGLLGRFSICP